MYVYLILNKYRYKLILTVLFIYAIHRIFLHIIYLYLYWMHVQFIVNIEFEKMTDKFLFDFW